jgi:hypothetical protein
MVRVRGAADAVTKIRAVLRESGGNQAVETTRA